MATKIVEDPIFKTDKLSIITCVREVTSRSIRSYMLKNWKVLTQGMMDATILIMAGVHGNEQGQLGGSAGNMKELENQFSAKILKKQNGDFILEDMKSKRIKIEFMDVLQFYEKSTTKINQEGLLSEIQRIGPKMVLMIICHSYVSELKFLLEGQGIFSELRINRDLCLLSKGQILTMTETQKTFLQTLAKPENITRNVFIEGQVGTGKTLLGIAEI